MDRRNNDGKDKVRMYEKPFEEGRILSPIEEECESRSKDESFTDSTISGTDDVDRQIMDLPYDDYRNSKRFQGNRHRFANGNNVFRCSAGESTSDDDKLARNTLCHGENGRTARRMKPEEKAAGDNDAEWRLHERSLKTTLKWLKCRLSRSEREIVALKKQLGAEKFQHRQFALQCHERHARDQDVLRKDLLTWCTDLNDRISSRIVKLQVDERRRTRDEIINVARSHYREIESILKQTIKELRSENARRITELIQRERNRQNDSIQKHLENLERRCREYYLNFRKQIDAWEERLKEEIVELHERNVKELRQQLQQNNAKDLRMQLLKLELDKQRENVTKYTNEKVAELWVAFDNFKHNFHLDCKTRDYLEVTSIATETSTVDSETQNETSKRKSRGNGTSRRC